MSIQGDYITAIANAIRTQEETSVAIPFAYDIPRRIIALPVGKQFTEEEISAYAITPADLEANASTAEKLQKYMLGKIADAIKAKEESQDIIPATAFAGRILELKVPKPVYYSTISLSIARENLAATSVGNYALFGGGYRKDGTNSVYENTVDAYDSSLTRTIPSKLSTARSSLAATSVGNYSLFGGGIIPV